MTSAIRWLVFVGLAGSLACGHTGREAVSRASRRLGGSVARGDAAGVRKRALPGVRAQIHEQELLAPKHRQGWADVLSSPRSVTQTAVVLLGMDWPVVATDSRSGFRFSDDPTDFYSQRTPRETLRTLVLASRMGRWDVMVGLAPRRYRMGLSQEDLRRAWSEGEQAQALIAARDRLADHLGGPIVMDAHEATLDLGDGHLARLEREGPRWVVVDF